VRLLVDTNVLLALVDERLYAIAEPLRDAVTDSAAVVHASVASLWEIAIKARLSKLVLCSPVRLLPELMRPLGLQLISINHAHVLTDVQPEPATRDPFDRLLLAQCMVENLRLVTTDRALAAHPLAWRAT
jgi:PIN domain nuclease of toxin-antitoxin system